MTISESSWVAYIDKLRAVSDEAADKFAAYYKRIRDPLSEAGRKALIHYAYVLSNKYGEAAAELACEMYDAMGVASGVQMGKPPGWIEPAVPAPTATYGETAKTVNGVLKVSQNEEIISGAVSRLVKMVGVDTVMNNALRDGAQWAWIPHGDTCAYCIALASQGWQNASAKALKNGHAEHIHGNCDCTYGVRFDENTEVEGYNDGVKYKKIYADAPVNEWNTKDGKPPKGHKDTGGKVTSKDRINAMRREFYKENSEEINEQKRSAYAKREERESSSAEELNT